MAKVTEKSKTTTVLLVNILYNWNQYRNMETMLCFLSPFWQSLSVPHKISISHSHCQSSYNTKFCCCSLTRTDLVHRADSFCNMLNALQNKRTIVLNKAKKLCRPCTMQQHEVPMFSALFLSQQVTWTQQQFSMKVAPHIMNVPFHVIFLSPLRLSWCLNTKIFIFRQLVLFNCCWFINPSNYDFIFPCSVYTNLSKFSFSIFSSGVLKDHQHTVILLP